MVDEVRYSFESRGLASGDKLTVVDFKGAEGISRPYEFTITLKSENPDIDFDTMLRARCELSLQLGSERNRFHGVLKNFDQLQQV
ncbi:MAG: contractile injection system protein, VgrG/Pvc8 family, partial [Gammaproteobacteria bacterium]